MKGLKWYVENTSPPANALGLCSAYHLPGALLPGPACSWIQDLNFMGPIDIQVEELSFLPPLFLPDAGPGVRNLYCLSSLTSDSDASGQVALFLI